MHQKMSVVIESLRKTPRKESAFLENYQTICVWFCFQTHIMYKCTNRINILIQYIKINNSGTYRRLGTKKNKGGVGKQFFKVYLYIYVIIY